MKLTSLVLLTSAFALVQAHADPVTVHPAADTALFENDPNNNFGKGNEIPAGTTRMGKRARMLMQFDLHKRIPTNAVINSAALSVQVTSVPSAPNANSTFSLRRMLQSWTEGTKTPSQHGAAATAGETSWRARVAPSTLWAAPGGAPGIDFSTNLSAAVTIAKGGNYTFASTSNLVADVQNWVLNPTNNFGWMMLTESEGTPKTARRFATREASAGAPSLVIDYTLPPPTAPFQVTNVVLSGGKMTFSFDAQAGQGYTVQTAASPEVPAWETLTNFNATASESVQISVPTDLPEHFFRVRSP